MTTNSNCVFTAQGDTVPMIETELLDQILALCPLFLIQKFKGLTLLHRSIICKYG